MHKMYVKIFQKALILAFDVIVQNIPNTYSFEITFFNILQHYIELEAQYVN